MMGARKPRDPAWIPVDYSETDVLAIKALADGTANEQQQRHALDWMIRVAAGAYELSYRSDADGGERETAFAEGRRFVGLQVVKMVNMAPKLVAELRKRNG